MMKFAVIVNLALATADLHLDATSDATSTCLAHGQWCTSGEECCSGCFYPIGIYRKCGPCDADDEFWSVLPAPVPAPVPVPDPAPKPDPTLESMSSCQPNGHCHYDREYAPKDCCSGCYQGVPASAQLCVPGAPYVCASCDAEDAVKLSETESTAGSAVNGRNVDANPTSALNSSVTCTATNKCEIRGASCCDHSDHGTAACSRTWCETRCLAGNVVKHCSSKEALCEAIGMGPEDPLADLCAAVWGGICVHNQQHDTCKQECGKLDGKRCGSANVLV